MHELSIALRLVELVEEQLANEPLETSVSAVYICVGGLSSVVPEALQFTWGAATKGTRLAGAALHIVPQNDSAALELTTIELNEAPSV